MLREIYPYLDCNGGPRGSVRVIITLGALRVAWVSCDCVVTVSTAGAAVLLLLQLLLLLLLVFVVILEGG